MTEFECFLPWVDGRPLINAVGSSENECHANLTMIDLSDEELQRVQILPATIKLKGAAPQ
ncbi:TPA: hypothetical protein ACP3ZG_000543 [Pseudomonas aeruginosa]|uniref:Uncharacterized protein n=1 Tax=Pseudomonas aeruginosa TaxID=287 RepID=A0A241XRK9_PSEAI|nr:MULTISPECIES: hypothetical protein [Pseudomonas]ELG7184128.1 hypothetical protein [Pseudomonas aeruginosa]MBI6602694.1 hypothetical protein [Pseudomonas sp. S4_EA_1b]MBI8852293.1 hypothetical protein [Pseudomonas aeruginosa]OBY57089.1 hypothetical protein A9513_016385 [Pseudomonas sp. AU12215]OTI63054.1 hypothetical protein CAZ10_09435 [Pseudomonas aeruginosa]